MSSTSMHTEPRHGANGAALAMLGNAVICGLLWWPLRHLADEGLHALWTTAFGYAAALVVLTGIAPRAWRSLAAAPGLWTVGLAAGMSNAAFNWAVTTGDVLRVVFLFYLMPLWAVLLARPLLGETPSRRAAALLSLAVTGCAIILWPPDGGLPWPRTQEDLLALASGLLFALATVMLRREGLHPPAARSLSVIAGGALVPAVAAVWLAHTRVVPGVHVDASSLSLAVFGMGSLLMASTWALQHGAARLAAATTAILMLVEVAVASLAAAWLGATSLAGGTLVGGALILLAAIAMARSPGREA